MLFHSVLYPPTSGSIKRNYHLFVEATKRHEVTLLVYAPPSDEATFREKHGEDCREIVFVPRPKSSWRHKLNFLLLMAGHDKLLHLRSRDLQGEIERLAREKFDLVFLSSPFFISNRLPAGVPVACDTHNVEYDNAYRAYREARGLRWKIFFSVLYRALRREEISSIRKADLLMVTSARDRDLFRKDLPDLPMAVVPNGVDTAYFAPQRAEVEPRSIVFTGIMEYYPNDHGAVYFLEKIFPLISKEAPDARLYIVGSNPSERVARFASDRVVVTGFVDDVRPYVARAEVVVIPLLIGGGTRLKALEALAMRKPIVTTSIGIEGIDVVNGKSVFIADTPEAFADAVLRLFRDPALGRDLTDEGARVVESTYRWEVIGDRLEEALRLAASAKSGTKEQSDREKY
jgi:polysaccharide biosynthesis protein PslH